MLSELRNSLFTVSDIFAEYQVGHENSIFERTLPRPADALLLFTNSTAIYRSQSKRPLYVPNGALVYIPRGCIYQIESHCVGECDRVEVLLFEFTLHRMNVVRGEKGEFTVSPPESLPMSLHIDEISILDLKPTVYKPLFLSMISLYESAHPSPVSIYRTAYAIFECLMHNAVLERAGSNPGLGKTGIDTALEYLGDLDAPEKSIEEIASLCCMSVSGFEKQFKQLTAMTPIAYRTACKIARVKQLLIAQPELSLSQIAEASGFQDAAYLCRCFKRNTGLSTRAFQAQYLRNSPAASS